MKRTIDWRGQTVTIRPLINHSKPKIVRVKIWKESVRAQTTKVIIHKKGGEKSE